MTHVGDNVEGAAGSQIPQRAHEPDAIINEGGVIEVWIMDPYP